MNKKKSSSSEREMINKSGIILGDELKIKSSMDKAVPLYIHIIQVLLVVGIAICPIISFFKCFNVQFNIILVTLVSVVVIIIEYLCIYQMKIFDRKLPFGAMIFVCIVVLLIQCKAIARGFIILLNKYVESINSYYEKEYMVNISVNGNTNLDVSKLIIAIIIIMSIIFTYYVINGLNSIVYYLCTGIWPILCYTVGCEPKGIYFIGYLGITIIVTSMDKVLKKYKISSEDMGKGLRQRKFRELAAINVGITMAIVICISYAMFNIVYSKQMFQNTNIVKNLNKIMNDVVGEIYYGNANGTGINNSLKDKLKIKNILSNKSVLVNGKISKSGEVSFEKKDVMKVVTSAITSDIYLKSYIGFDYDWGWVTKKKAVSDSEKYTIDEESYSNLVSEAEIAYDDRIAEREFIYIKDRRGVEGKDLIPIATSLDYTINKDGFLIYNTNTKENAVGAYTAEFSQVYDLLELKIDVESEMEENNKEDNIVKDKLYKKAKETYSQVPKGLVNACNKIKPEVEEYAKTLRYGNFDEPEGGKLTQLDYLCGLIYYLNRNYTYTLSPGEVPKGMDPIEYFLTKNKKGYCVYYAAAATAFLRYVGIPTRYVEGYVISYDDQENAVKVDSKEYINKLKIGKKVNQEDDFEGVTLYEYNIKDSNGHAWIEVYFKGVGWVPVEVTSSSLLQNDRFLENEQIIDNLTDLPEETENTDDIDNEITPTPKENNVNEKDNKENNEEKDVTTTKESKKQGQDKMEDSNNLLRKKNNKWIMLIMFIVCVLTIIMGIVCIIYRKYKKHVDKYEKLIKDDVVSYMSEIISYIFYKEGIVFSSNIDYNQYAEQIANRYSQYSYNDIREFIDILLKRRYSSEPLDKSEILLCIKYYNSIVEEYIRQFKPKEQLLECKIKKYIKKV